MTTDERYFVAATGFDHYVVIDSDTWGRVRQARTERDHFPKREAFSFAENLNALPREAAYKCRRCEYGIQRPVPSTRHVDEGDGSAMVSTECDRCPVQSVYYWTPDDQEYFAEFGHAFGDLPDDAFDDD